MAKIRVCFSLKESNVKLLNKSKGIATLSAYLDYLIEKSLCKREK